MKFLQVCEEVIGSDRKTICNVLPDLNSTLWDFGDMLLSNMKPGVKAVITISFARRSDMAKAQNNCLAKSWNDHTEECEFYASAIPIDMNDPYWIGDSCHADFYEEKHE